MGDQVEYQEARAGGTSPTCTIETYHSGATLWHYTQALAKVDRPAIVRWSWATEVPLNADVLKLDVIHSISLNLDKADRGLDTVFGEKAGALVYITTFRRDRNVQVNVVAPDGKLDLAQEVMAEFHRIMPELMEDDP